jgi:hypothetical protein
MHYGRIWPSSALRRRRGAKGSKSLLAIEEGSRLPSDAHASLTVLATQLQAVQCDDWIAREADHCAASLERSK